MAATTSPDETISNVVEIDFTDSPPLGAVETDEQREQQRRYEQDVAELDALEAQTRLEFFESAATRGALLDAALAYARNGLKVLPLWPVRNGVCACGLPDAAEQGHPRGKHPIGRIAPNGGSDATTDEGTITRWWTEVPDANIGATTEGHFVLDVDPRNGGDTSLTALTAEHGPLPVTKTVHTGGGGWHFTFLLGTLPDGIKLPKSGVNNPLAGLDFKADGPYVVVPPSVHASGGMYERVDDGPPVAAPDWLLRSVAAKQSGGTEGGTSTAGRTVNEGARNDTLFREAAWMRNRGYSVGAILGALRSRNASDCIPPLADADVVRIAESAGRYEPAPSGTHRAQSRALGGGDWLFADRPALVANWGSTEQMLAAHKQSTMVFADTGLGKTTLAHNYIVRRIGLRSDPLLGLPVPTASGALLLLSCDRPEQARASLLRMVSTEDREVLNQRLHVWEGPLPFDIGKEPGALLALVEQYPDVVEVVVDSLKDVAVGLSGDEVGGNVNRAFQMVIAADVDVLVLNITRKPSPDNPRPFKLSDAYGSAHIVGGMGSVISLGGQQGDAVVTVRQVKPLLGAAVDAIEMSIDFGTGAVTGDSATSGDQPVVAAVEAAGSEGVTAADIAYVRTNGMSLTVTKSEQRNEEAKAVRQLDRLAQQYGWHKQVGARGAGNAARWRAHVPGNGDDEQASDSTE